MEDIVPQKSLADVLGVRDPLTNAVPTSEPFVEVDPSSIEQFCQAVLNSRQYRDSLIRRIVMDELPPAVEVMLYDRAYGARPQRLEHTGKDGKPIETVTEIRRIVVRSLPAEESQPIETVVH